MKKSILLMGVLSLSLGFALWSAPAKAEFGEGIVLNPSPGLHVWTPAEIQATEQAHRSIESCTAADRANGAKCLADDGTASGKEDVATPVLQKQSAVETCTAADRANGAKCLADDGTASGEEDVATPVPQKQVAVEPCTAADRANGAKCLPWDEDQGATTASLGTDDGYGAGSGSEREQGEYNTADFNTEGFSPTGSGKDTASGTTPATAGIGAAVTGAKTWVDALKQAANGQVALAGQQRGASPASGGGGGDFGSLFGGSSAFAGLGFDTSQLSAALGPITDTLGRVNGALSKLPPSVAEKLSIDTAKISQGLGQVGAVTNQIGTLTTQAGNLANRANGLISGATNLEGQVTNLAGRVQGAVGDLGTKASGLSNQIRDGYTTVTSKLSGSEPALPSADVIEPTFRPAGS